MQTPPALTVRAARKRFGDVQALNSASFDLRQGELLGLLGPNGAGKTSLIRAIAGRLRLDEGTIEIDGAPITPGVTRPELGIVPQELAVYPLLSARENLEVFGRLYGVAPSALRARVDWALDHAALADRASEPVKLFSGGMKRRLNIVCAVMHEPRIVLLDEPTVGVDPQSRERIYDMLTELRQTGVSILLTTHHLEEAEARCQRIVIIDHGRAIASGTLSELVTQSLGSSRVAVIRTLKTIALPAALPAGAEVDEDGRTIRATVDAGASSLPELTRLAAVHGGGIEDISMHGARLQDVFINLTGRELRE
ncbi:MAG: ABC transporter ATP-binding protein [Acidobacteriota bacterium]|nr:ABC transporter ATP-binding protein [Acidobacteriota bacterium]